MPLGTPCNCIMAIIDHSNAAMPFVVTAYPALQIALTKHCGYTAICKFKSCINELIACMLHLFR